MQRLAVLLVSEGSALVVLRAGLLDLQLRESILLRQLMDADVAILIEALGGLIEALGGLMDTVAGEGDLREVSKHLGPGRAEHGRHCSLVLLLLESAEERGCVFNATYQVSK